MEDWWGIYKGLRLPVLGMLLIIMTWVIYRSKNKKKHEEIRFSMLDDDLDPHLSEEVKERLERGKK